MNPFNRLDPQKLELEGIEQEVRNELKAISFEVRELLLDNRYQKFAKLVKEAETNIIELLLKYKESDPYKYKAKADEYLIELGVYRKILYAAKDLTDAQEKPKVNFVQKFKKDMAQVLDRIK